MSQRSKTKKLVIQEWEWRWLERIIGQHLPLPEEEKEELYGVILRYLRHRKSCMRRRKSRQYLIYSERVGIARSFAAGYVPAAFGSRPDTLFFALRMNFGWAAERLRDAVLQVNDVAEVKRLVKATSTCESLADFEKEL